MAAEQLPLTAETLAGLLQEQLTRRDKSMPKLIVSNQVYDPTKLAGWVARRRNVLPFPEESAEFARLLKRKVRGRGVRSPRFFGEAFVVSQTRHSEAYYSSSKWLTNVRFAGDRKFVDNQKERLRQALHRHFTQRRLEKLQRAVQALVRSSGKEMGGKQPTAPDLWLVDKRGHHRFIEVKLPGDSVAPHQLAGMAAIASVLNGPKSVAVEVVHLDNNDQLFKTFCQAIAAG